MLYIEEKESCPYAKCGTKVTSPVTPSIVNTVHLSRNQAAALTSFFCYVQSWKELQLVADLLLMYI